MEICEFEKIFKGDSGKWDGDNAMQGLKIIEKYFPPDAEIIQGAGHDVIWSVDAEELVEYGITKEDAEELRRLNWMIEEGEYMACFV